MHVGQNFAEGTLTAIGFVMLFARKPAQEIRRTVVELVGDEMVTDTAIRLTPFRVEEGRTRTIESDGHEYMAWTRYTLSHTRVGCSSLVVDLRRSEGVFGHLTVRSEEVAIGVSPTDDGTAVVINFETFAALSHEPGA